MEQVWTQEERRAAAVKIDEIIESQQFAVEKIGNHGYTPGILDIQCELAALRASLAQSEAERERLQGELGQCYILSGADPDMDAEEPWRLAPYAVREVKRMREESDQADSEVIRLQGQLVTVLARESATTSRYDAKLEQLEAELERVREERDELLYHTRHASPDDVEWHSPQTVGHLRRQLETLDPNMAIGCAYFVNRIAKITGVSMSYESVNHELCRIEENNKNIPRGIIIWAHSTDAEGLRAELARERERHQGLMATNERLTSAIYWALGYEEFRQRGPKEGAYWWRTELRSRALLADEAKAEPAPVATGEETK